MARLAIYASLLFALTGCIGAYSNLYDNHYENHYGIPIPISEKTKTFEQHGINQSEKVILDFCSSNVTLTGISIHGENDGTYDEMIYEKYDYLYSIRVYKKDIHKYYVNVEHCRFLLKPGNYSLSYVVIFHEPGIDPPKVSYATRQSKLPSNPFCYQNEVSGKAKLISDHTYSMQVQTYMGPKSTEPCKEPGASATWLIDVLSGEIILGALPPWYN